MLASFHGHPSIPGSPDLSRSSPSGHSRTSSARPSESRSYQCSPSRLERIPHTDGHDTHCPENETLTTSSHGFRPARHLVLSPGPRPYPVTPPHSAISDQYLSYPPPDHNVDSVSQLLNQRPISRRPGLSPNSGHQVSSPTALESFELSSSSTRHAAINSHSARPRTSNQVFNNISDLAAHYGIPQFLPIAPRTIPHRTDCEDLSSSHTDTFVPSPDFENLCSNYLTMLSQPDDSAGDDVLTKDTVPVATTIQVTNTDAVRSLMDVLNVTPELQMSSDLNEYLTSPLIDSPLDDLLATPAVGSDMHADIMTSPLLGDFGGSDSFGDFPSLFGEFDDDDLSKPPQNDPSVFPHPPDFDGMYSLESPNTPLIDSLVASPSAPRKRKSTVTGTRKNLTPQSLVPIDAPTQSRKYLTPSVTSRKELPATWRRKRARPSGLSEEDELAEEGLTPTLSEQEQIELKRRQNTIAARRSRKRKLEYQQELEENLERYKRESEIWKQRAMTCQALLRSHHIEFPDF